MAIPGGRSPGEVGGGDPLWLSGPPLPWSLASRPRATSSTPTASSYSSPAPRPRLLPSDGFLRGQGRGGHAPRSRTGLARPPSPLRPITRTPSARRRWCRARSRRRRTPPHRRSSALTFWTASAVASSARLRIECPVPRGPPPSSPPRPSPRYEARHARMRCFVSHARVPRPRRSCRRTVRPSSCPPLPPPPLRLSASPRAPCWEGRGGVPAAKSVGDDWGAPVGPGGPAVIGDWDAALRPIRTWGDPPILAWPARQGLARGGPSGRNMGRALAGTQGQ